MSKIWGDKINTTVSRLESFAKCPFSYFMKYGLRAQERKEATVDPAEFGTYVHAVLEQTAKEMAGRFSDRLNTIFKECVTGFDFAQNLVVVHTIPGLAGAAASAVDSMEMRFILGTVAGDDTVLIIMRDMDAAAMFCSDLKDFLG